MKKFSHKVLSFILVFVMVLAVAPQVAYAAEPMSNGNIENRSSDEKGNTTYYGRTALSALDNGEALLYAYDQIAAGIEATSAEIVVQNGSNTITQEEIQTVIDAYRRDYTQHFWLGSSYSWELRGNYVSKVMPTYTMTGETLAVAKAEFEQAAEEILSGVSDSMSDYEKELYLHDALASHITYTSGANVHNAYGALVEGKAVCEGYAEALQYLLHCVGIESFIAEGTSINPNTNNTENHAWNYVKIDGNYYHVDLTWNDQESVIYHAYFNQTDAVIKEDHVIATATYALPVCDEDEAHYFNGKDANLSTYTVESVGKLLEENDLKVHVYIPGDVDAFLTWYGQNIIAIATEAGVNESFAYGYSVLGREIVLSINTGCLHENLSPIIAKMPTCTAEGNIAYYVCECGKWFADASASIEIRDHNSVELPKNPHIWNEDYTIDLAPTYDAPGSKSIHCSVCDTIKEGSAVIIPKLEKTENPFTDLEEGFFYVEPVLWAVEHGITSGTTETTFSPNATCNRGQVVTFLHRAAGKPAPTSTTTAFADLQAGWFYEDAVLWAVENGITSGTSATTFSPDAPCTRAQVVTFLWRAMGCPTPTSTENPFTDLQPGYYYNDAVLWAVENGITSGTSATTFGPDEPCTRGQVVTFLYRTYY